LTSEALKQWRDLPRLARFYALLAIGGSVGFFAVHELIGLVRYLAASFQAPWWLAAATIAILTATLLSVLITWKHAYPIVARARRLAILEELSSETLQRFAVNLRLLGVHSTIKSDLESAKALQKSLDNNLLDAGLKLHRSITYLMVISKANDVSLQEEARSVAKHIRSLVKETPNLDSVLAFVAQDIRRVLEHYRTFIGQ
jgi:hypothetical protein